jgi:hypothetical protein
VVRYVLIACDPISILSKYVGKPTGGPKLCHGVERNRQGQR